MILYETLANGHNEVAIAFCILLAAWALQRHRYKPAILALLAGTLLKFIPALLLSAAGLIALRDLPRFARPPAIPGHDGRTWRAALCRLCSVPRFTGPGATARGPVLAARPSP
jgi:hypothetical protein